MIRPSSGGFEVFAGAHRPRRLAPEQASLTKTNILLSHALEEQLGNVGRVLLSFNRDTQEIALQPAGPQTQGTYKLSCRSVSASAFYHHFRITARGRFPARIRGGRVVISLKETASVQ